MLPRVPLRVRALRLRTCGALDRRANRPGPPDGRLFPSRVLFRIHFEHHRHAADGSLGTGRLSGHLHRLALDRRASRRMLHISAAVVDWHARIEPNWRIPDPPLWLALTFLASLVVLALLLDKKYLRWPALLAVLGLFTLLIRHPFPAQTSCESCPPTLELTAIDVGQGDIPPPGLPSRCKPC